MNGKIGQSSSSLLVPFLFDFLTCEIDLVRMGKDRVGGGLLLARTEDSEFKDSDPSFPYSPVFLSISERSSDKRFS